MAGRFQPIESRTKNRNCHVHSICWPGFALRWHTQEGRKHPNNVYSHNKTGERSSTYDTNTTNSMGAMIQSNYGIIELRLTDIRSVCCFHSASGRRLLCSVPRNDRSRLWCFIRDRLRDCVVIKLTIAITETDWHSLKQKVPQHARALIKIQ
jgi:hypothetical protein